MNRALENKCKFYKNNFFNDRPLIFSGKEINLGPLNEDQLFSKNSVSLQYKNKFENNKLYQNVPNNTTIQMDGDATKEDPITRVNPPSKKQIGVFVALTIMTIYTQGLELGRSGPNPLGGEDGDLRVMTNEEMCASGWIFGEICIRPFQSFWIFKQLLLVFYFVMCFLFFKKYF